MNPHFLNHTIIAYNHMPLGLDELALTLRRDAYTGNIIFVNPQNNQEQINLTMLSHDLIQMNNRLESFVAPPVMDPRVEEMQTRIDYLEEKINQLTFMLGEN